jgi:protein NrfC
VGGPEDLSRRDALKLLGTVLLATGCSVHGGLQKDAPTLVIPASRGYLLVDPRKCQGCKNCMAVCSLVHHGTVNPSLSRVQVVHQPLARFPDDALVAQCRQCVEPACLRACPTGALHADPASGYVRTVNQAECIGCMRCVAACPFPPARSVWNHEGGVSQKCDLCADTPFWQEAGGPAGRKACVEICPLGAIAHTDEIPAQTSDAGYVVNLRGAAWTQFGLTTD